MANRSLPINTFVLELLTISEQSQNKELWKSVNYGQETACNKQSPQTNLIFAVLWY